MSKIGVDEKRGDEQLERRRKVGGEKMSKKRDEQEMNNYREVDELERGRIITERGVSKRGGGMGD